MVRGGTLLTVGVVSCLILGGIGCGSKAVVKLPPASTQLWKINGAYIRATMVNDSPPQSKADLLPFLLNPKGPNADDTETDKAEEKPNPEDFFKSFGDGEEFVILWGVDCRNYDLSGNQTGSPVIAYEKYGVDGTRYVLQFRKVSKATNEELANLPFPPGFKAP
jgi:hypothetical protein